MNPSTWSYVETYEPQASFVGLRQLSREKLWVLGAFDSNHRYAEVLASYLRYQPEDEVRGGEAN